MAQTKLNESLTSEDWFKFVHGKLHVWVEAGKVVVRDPAEEQSARGSSIRQAYDTLQQKIHG